MSYTYHVQIEAVVIRQVEVTSEEPLSGNEISERAKKEFGIVNCGGYDEIRVVEIELAWVKP